MDHCEILPFFEMSPLMIIPVADAFESFVAVLALEGFLVGVYALVDDQVTLLIEFFAADITHELVDLLLVKMSDVQSQPEYPRVTFLALVVGTSKGLIGVGVVVLRVHG